MGVGCYNRPSKHVKMAYLGQYDVPVVRDCSVSDEEDLPGTLEPPTEALETEDGLDQGGKSPGLDEEEKSQDLQQDTTTQESGIDDHPTTVPDEPRQRRITHSDSVLPTPKAVTGGMREQMGGSRESEPVLIPIDQQSPKSNRVSPDKKVQFKNAKNDTSAFRTQAKPAHLSIPSRGMTRGEKKANDNKIQTLRIASPQEASAWKVGDMVWIMFTKVGWRKGRIVEVFTDDEGECLTVRDIELGAVKDVSRTNSRVIRPYDGPENKSSSPFANFLDKLNKHGRPQKRWVLVNADGLFYSKKKRSMLEILPHVTVLTHLSRSKSFRGVLKVNQLTMVPFVEMDTVQMVNGSGLQFLISTCVNSRTRNDTFQFRSSSPQEASKFVQAIERGIAIAKEPH